MAKDEENAADAEYKLILRTWLLCGHSAAVESTEIRLTSLECMNSVVFGLNIA